MPILTSIALKDFRNYEELSLELGPGINVFVGANGQGKTNLLEAVYFLSILRSFRCQQVRNLQRWRAKTFMVRGQIGAGKTGRLAVEYGEKRRLRADGKSLGRASDFIGRFFCAAFVPEDIELIRGPSGERRRFLDIALSQLEPHYLTVLQQYQKALKSRHQLLRRETLDVAALEAYDAVLVETGAAIIVYRAAFVAELQELVAAAGAALFPAESSLAMRFTPSIPAADDPADDNACRVAFAAALAACRERDRQRQQTHVGPHRDDFAFLLDGKDLVRFGSEGQCRLAALALKKAKADLLLSRRREGAVVLLVDDVIGELDERGRRAFFESLAAADQTLVACTREDVVEALAPAAVFDVSVGAVSRREPAAGD